MFLRSKYTLRSLFYFQNNLTIAFAHRLRDIEVRASKIIWRFVKPSLFLGGRKTTCANMPNDIKVYDTVNKSGVR